jgi:FKBP-type peptidyl-prolyl cis-trans isomerase
MGHVLLLAAAWVLARSDAVLHRTTTGRSLANRRAALSVIALTPVATKADEAVELPNGCTYAKVADGSGPVPKRGDVVAVRLRGLLESGAVFIDSFNEGGPILWELGSVVSAPRVDGRVTPGVDAAVALMRGGEIGRLIVPYDAGYGPGLSLYGTRKAGLKTRWVPSGETLRYEIELLRCRDVGGKFSGDGARVCCSDKKFPCPGPDTDGGDAEMTRK